MIGQTISHYRITEKLGAGGMGEVYRAEDSRLGRQVAIKVLPEMFSGDPERMARFEREARLLASLTHPNIAAIHGLEEVDGKRFIVMELVEGETLAQRIDKGALPLDESLEICRQIAEGLEAAHEKGVIHRDLKPANIKITPECKVKILDFGLAKAFEGDPGAPDATHSPTLTDQMTRPGVILGTAAYMSPEQAKGKAVDKKTDIWAFGCILFECLAGKRPFEGETVTETLASILKGEPDWQAIPAATPWQIRELLRRCLEKNPRDRLHDIADARIEIAKPSSHKAVLESAQPGTIRRGSMIAAVAITLLFSVTAAALITWWLKPAPGQPGVRAVIDLPNGTQLTREDVGPTHTELALAPDGRNLVFSASPDGSPGKAMLYIRPLEKFEATQIAGTMGARAPFFSPDGQWVGFWQGGKLKKWPLGGGIPADICECPQVPLGATWSSTGAIVIGTDGNGLELVDAQEGKLTSLTTPERANETQHVLPWFLPGGKALLFTVKPHAWGTRGRIEAFWLDSRKRQVLIENGADARFVPATGHLVYMSEGTLMAVPFDAGKMEKRGRPEPLVDGVAQALNAPDSSQTSGAGQFVVSLNGTLIYASGGIFADRETHLIWVDRNRRTEPLMQSDKKWIMSVRVSPDGRHLAYRTKGKFAEVWVLDLTLGTSRRITREGQAMSLCWTPDGTRLTFAYSKAGIPNIFWKAADGSGAVEPEPLVASEYALQPSCWSRNGEQLLFVEDNPKSNYDIWVYRKASREKAPLFNADYNEQHPAISTGGRWLAYCSDETGRNEIYVTSMSNPAKGVPITSDGGLAPVWAPDDRTLYYWNPDWTKLMGLEIIALEPGIKAGKPHEIFAFPSEHMSWVRHYDISPDGSRFLIPSRGEIKPFEVTRLNLVQNWFEELKRLCPTGK